MKPALKNETENQHTADQLYITEYTDPLCCWSWAMQPVFEKFRSEFGSILNWRYCMGGLIPTWNNYFDPVNSVNRPLQMGPIWLHASQISGVEMNHRIWFTDPPASSYPSCIAYKSVEMQSATLAIKYLDLIRESCFVDGLNIARTAVLIRIADKLLDFDPTFNTKLFKEHLLQGEGKRAFAEDMAEISKLKISRFPTLVLRQKGSSSLLITGYRSYDSLVSAVTDMEGERS